MENRGRNCWEPVSREEEIFAFGWTGNDDYFFFFFWGVGQSVKGDSHAGFCVCPETSGSSVRAFRVREEKKKKRNRRKKSNVDRNRTCRRSHVERGEPRATAEARARTHADSRIPYPGSITLWACNIRRIGAGRTNHAVPRSSACSLIYAVYISLFFIYLLLFISLYVSGSLSLSWRDFAPRLHS